MTIVDKLAAKAGDVLGSGIPWSTFDQQPTEDVYGKVQYYVALSQEMRQVMSWADDVAWTWDVVNGPESAKALMAWQGVNNGLLSSSSVIDAALKTNASRLSDNEAPKWEKEVLRAFFSQMFSLAMRGYETHHNILMQHAKVDAARIVNNADMVFFTMRSLNRLHGLGAFNAFQKTTIGAPITPPIAAVIAVGAVAALIVIAWFVTKMTAILAQWEVTSAACAASLADPSNPELRKACAEAQQNLNRTGKTKGPLNTLSGFAGVGILILAVGYVLPGIMQSSRSKR